MDEAISAFAKAHVNRALLTADEVDEAVRLSIEAGIPVHADRLKNWDNLIAVVHAAEGSGDVIDAGVGDGSAFLEGLRNCGYRSGILLGIGHEVKYPLVRAGVFYRPGDIRSMPFADRTVGFVMCQSVIEHMRRDEVLEFLSEAARVLRPGGKLFISTDYWIEGVDAGDREAFGRPVNVFSFLGIQALLLDAGERGFDVPEVVECRCQDKVVSWLGLEYTFINVLLTRR